MVTTSLTQPKRVLSIQSHVVVGHVGNKSATFPLQLLEWDVDVLNTVQFSNHTGYGRWGGMRMDAKHLQEVFDAMDQNGLLRQSHLLTGYIPGAEALQAVAGMVSRLREVNPQLVYILDPVLGDDGKMYVPQEVIPIYKSMLPLADCATPNHFEAEVLTGIKIISLETLKQALNAFHELFEIPHIIFSSVPSSLLAEVEPGYLLCAGSSRPKGSKVSQQFTITFPSLPEHYEGVGDVFSSLVLANFNRPPQAACPLSQTAERAIASLQGILHRTRDHALASVGDMDLSGTNPDETAEERIRRLIGVELRLVQSWKEIKEPNVIHKARPLS